MSARDLGHLLVLVALVVGAADWVAVARRAVRARYVLKPLTLIVLIVAAAILGEAASTTLRIAVLAALGFSLLGDVFLMLPWDFFTAGLGSFLLAHIAYVVAFDRKPPPLGPALISLYVVGVLATIMFLRLREGMRRTGQRQMTGPVAVYVLSIAAMAASAAATVGRPDWDPAHSALAVTGATLFLVSDGLIGWTRFVGTLRWGPSAIIVTYHLAQAALVLALLG